jgi:hypothetical protein
MDALEVGIDHHGYQLFEGDAWLPVQPGSCFGVENTTGHD